MCTMEQKVVFIPLKDYIELALPLIYESAFTISSPDYDDKEYFKFMKKYENPLASVKKLFGDFDYSFDNGHYKTEYYTFGKWVRMNGVDNISVFVYFKQLDLVKQLDSSKKSDRLKSHTDYLKDGYDVIRNEHGVRLTSISKPPSGDLRYSAEICESKKRSRETRYSEEICAILRVDSFIYANGTMFNYASTLRMVSGTHPEYEIVQKENLFLKGKIVSNDIGDMAAIIHSYIWKRSPSISSSIDY